MSYLAAISCFLSRPADALLILPERDLLRFWTSPETEGILPRTSEPGDQTLSNKQAGEVKILYGAVGEVFDIYAIVTTKVFN